MILAMKKKQRRRKEPTRTDKPLSPGAALVRKRWEKTTAAQRRAHAMKMVEARRKKREQGKPPE
jgi:hypothetical protein